MWICLMNPASSWLSAISTTILAALNGEPCTVVLLANGGAASFLARKDNAQTEATRNWLRPGFPSAYAPTP